jgi:hypothetical protein
MCYKRVAPNGAHYPVGCFEMCSHRSPWEGCDWMRDDREGFKLVMKQTTYRICITEQCNF